MSTNPYYPDSVSERDIDRIGEPIQGDDIFELQEMLKEVRKLISNAKKEEAEILERLEALK